MSKQAQRFIKDKQGRVTRGNELVQSEVSNNREEYKLSWFRPTQAQSSICYSMQVNDLTIVQAVSGAGKSSTAIWQALSLLKQGKYKHIVFVKTPCEDGDDQIGYLTGDANQKLIAHFEAMRTIFTDFMSKGKLECDEKNGRIQFSIPNFIAGKTLYDSILIIDEGQKVSPNTMKLLLERVSDSCAVVVLGDKAQRYAKNKRADGLTDLINRVTNQDGVCVEDNMSVIKLGSENNVRGRLSKRIVEIYGDDDE
jgi:predicted ribonuclease YlaK